MLEKLLQLILNGLMAGAVLAVPAIGLTMIFAVLRFVNFSIAGHMAVGAFTGYVLNAWFGLPAWIAILSQESHDKRHQISGSDSYRSHSRD